MSKRGEDDVELQRTLSIRHANRAGSPPVIGWKGAAPSVTVELPELSSLAPTPASPTSDWTGSPMSISRRASATFGLPHGGLGAHGCRKRRRRGDGNADVVATGIYGQRSAARRHQTSTARHGSARERRREALGERRRGDRRRGRRHGELPTQHPTGQAPGCGRHRNRSGALKVGIEEGTRWIRPTSRRLQPATPNPTSRPSGPCGPLGDITITRSEPTPEERP